VNAQIAAIGNHIAREYRGGQFSMEAVPNKPNVRFKLQYGPLSAFCECTRQDFEQFISTQAGTKALADQILSEMRDHLEIYRVVDASTGDTVWRGTSPSRYLPDPGKPYFMERLGSDGYWTATTTVYVSPRSTGGGDTYAAYDAAYDANRNETRKAISSALDMFTGIGATRSTAAARAAEEEKKKRDQEAELIREQQRQEAERREMEERVRRDMQRLEAERLERIRRSATASFEPLDAMLRELRGILGKTAETEAALRDARDEDSIFGTGAASVQKEILWADARKKLLELQAFVNERVEELDARIDGCLNPVDISDADTERALSRQQERNAPEYTRIEEVPVRAPEVDPAKELSDLDQFLDVLS